MIRNLFCFLDSNIIFSMSVGGIIKTEKEEIIIRHKFYPDTLELKEKMRKKRGLVLSSSTVLTEIMRKIDDVVSVTVTEFKSKFKEDWEKLEKRNIFINRVIDEIRIQSYDNLTNILSLIHLHPFDNFKSEQLKPQILEFLNKYYDEYLMKLVKMRKIPPPERLHSLNRDAKIISDVLVIREDLEKESQQKIKIHFVTMDSFLTNFPDISKFYHKFNFNCYWPCGDILKVI